MRHWTTVLLEWPNDRGQPNDFIYEMKIGDIILMRHNGPKALVEVIGDVLENEEDEEGEKEIKSWFDIYREVKVLSRDGEAFKAKFEGNWQEGLINLSTLSRANNSPFITAWHRS